MGKTLKIRRKQTHSKIEKTNFDFTGILRYRLSNDCTVNKTWRKLWCGALTFPWLNFQLRNQDDDCDCPPSRKESHSGSCSAYKYFVWLLSLSNPTLSCRSLSVIGSCICRLTFDLYSDSLGRGLGAEQGYCKIRFSTIATSLIRALLNGFCAKSVTLTRPSRRPQSSVLRDGLLASASHSGNFINRFCYNFSASRQVAHALQQNRIGSSFGQRSNIRLHGEHGYWDPLLKLAMMYLISYQCHTPAEMRSSLLLLAPTKWHLDSRALTRGIRSD